MAPYDVSGKVFFITGAAGGFGYGYANAVLSRGAKVFFCDLNKTKGEESAKDLGGKYGADRVKFAPCDVSNRDQYEDVFKKAVAHFGHVDVLVNNAGILNEFKIPQMITVNFLGTVFGTEIGMTHMDKGNGGKGGRIINTGSVVGLTTPCLMPGYSATKHAIRAYTTAVSESPDLEEKCIEIAVLHPDACPTAFYTTISEANCRFPEIFAVSKEMTKDSMMTPDQVIDAFMQLVSLEQMNGANLYVTAKAKTYVKMEKVDVGQSYTPEVTETTQLVKKLWLQTRSPKS